MLQNVSTDATVPTNKEGHAHALKNVAHLPERLQ